jgi:hypothetical protein
MKVQSNRPQQARVKKTITAAASLILIIGCSALLGACGGKEVSFSSGGMQETQKSGKDSVPSDLSAMVYPGATASGSQSAKAEDKEVTDESQYLQLSSADTIEKVAAWYEQTLKNAGWNIEKKETMGNMVTISGTMKDSEVSVTIADESGTTSILITKSTSVGTGPVPEEGDNENYKPNKKDVTPTD